MSPDTPPAGTRCTATREWVRPDGAHLLVGLVPSALAEAGTPTAVELPEPGRKVQEGESVAMVETAKTAFDVYAPVSGTVEAANLALPDRPQLLALDPWGQWLFALVPENLP